MNFSLLIFFFYDFDISFILFKLSHSKKLKNTRFQKIKIINLKKQEQEKEIKAINCIDETTRIKEKKREKERSKPVQVK